jgi:stage II sporulation protein D
VPRGTPFCWWGVVGAVLATGCPKPQPVTIGPEPELRVGLAAGVSIVRLGGVDGGELFVTDDGDGSPVAAIPAGATWAVVPDSTGGLALVRPDGSRTERHGGISAVNVTEGRFAVADGRRYRGRLNVVRVRSGLTLINRVPLESYLAGVVGQELGPRRPDEREALLAQAIVSRTFALRNLGRWEADGFDATADTRDQVYLGVVGESPQVWDALRATTGLVLRYHGRLIEAFFHSTCGGRTADVGEVFRSAQRHPYLRSVSDASSGGHAYCETSPRFRWREEWDGPTLHTILSRTLTSYMDVGSGGVPPIRDVQVTRTTGSGRVGELRIEFTHGDVRIQEPQVRGVLRPATDRPLLSATFHPAVTRRDGVVSRLAIEGRGAGHGVGMCQWGAIGRARAGQGYGKILTTYFPGTVVERLY